MMIMSSVVSKTGSDNDIHVMMIMSSVVSMTGSNNDIHVTATPMFDTVSSQ